jgi:hypothetical protein
VDRDPLINRDLLRDRGDLRLERDRERDYGPSSPKRAKEINVNDSADEDEGEDLPVREDDCGSVRGDCDGSGGGGRQSAASGNDDDDEKMKARKKKTRTVFSRSQVFQLESTFDMKRYLSSSERAGLAASLHLTETQVGCLGEESLQTKIPTFVLFTCQRQYVEVGVKHDYEDSARVYRQSRSNSGQPRLLHTALGLLCLSQQQQYRRELSLRKTQ